MKIGILTFHWATNYGAVLQCYALQSYLSQMGHDVCVINYKPRQFDNNIRSFLKFRKFLHLADFVREMKKERAIAQFRNDYLNQSRRCFDINQVAAVTKEYDVVVAGSDQILNPYFLMHGEGSITPTYFLGFPFNGKKIAYAVSFGCTEYPKEASVYAEGLIGNFEYLSVRENSGADIVRELGADSVTIVPDPTALMPKDFYSQLSTCCEALPQDYTYLFFLRNIKERISALQEVVDGTTLWNNNNGNYGVEDWLRNIALSTGVVTDSFHAMMMALKLEVPFVVVTDKPGNVGMNDRFYSLLERLHLSERIVDAAHIGDVASLLAKKIDWHEVKALLEIYSRSGADFLEESLKG